jgi:hypothetical protein
MNFLRNIMSLKGIKFFFKLVCKHIIDLVLYSDNKIDLEFVKNLFVKNANIEAYVQHFNVSSPFQASSQVIGFKNIRFFVESNLDRIDK